MRAAQELREAMTRVNADLERERGVKLGVRTGINTGDVVAGDPSGGQFYATGDAVNVAARLEQTASAGEIVLGQATYQLVRGMVEAEALDQRALKGKTDAVAAYRLLEVLDRATALTRSFDTPFVGRTTELAQLLACFEHSVAEQAPTLVTVLGPAGDREDAPRRKTGCGGRRRRDGPAGAVPLIRRGHHLLAAAGAPPQPRGASSRCARSRGSTKHGGNLLGLPQIVRGLARDRPLLLVLEDIHWAEPTLLDLIEHVVEWTSDVPIMIVCLARPDLVEDRPGWPGERVELDPLAEEEAKTLVAALAADLTPPVESALWRLQRAIPSFSSSC